jgi:hypothetical protein
MRDKERDAIDGRGTAKAGPGLVKILQAVKEELRVQSKDRSERRN